MYSRIERENLKIFKIYRQQKNFIKKKKFNLFQKHFAQKPKKSL